MRPDLHATRLAMLAGASDARTELEQSIAAAESPSSRHVYLRTMFDEARADAASASPGQPLAGLAFSAKDLFDVAGQATPAGSVVLAHAPAADRRRAWPLHGCAPPGRPAGAHQHVGVRVLRRRHQSAPRHAGQCLRPADAAHSGRLVLGGGGLGGRGAAFIGLGSDTGGSIRTPAALNGIVGFKSTARLVPTGRTRCRCPPPWTPCAP